MCVEFDLREMWVSSTKRVVKMREKESQAGTPSYRPKPKAVSKAVSSLPYEALSVSTVPPPATAVTLQTKP